MLYVLGLIIGLVLAVGAWGGLIAGQAGAPTTASVWLKDLFDVKDVAVQSASPSSIVIVGGTDVLFGLSADEISASLSRDVTNYGMHEDLGLTYLLHRVRQIVRPGDDLVLVLDYQRMAEGEGVPPLLRDYLLNDDLAHIRTWEPVTALRFLAGVPSSRLLQGYRALAGLPQDSDWPFSRGLLEVDGDVRPSGNRASAEESWVPGAAVPAVLSDTVKTALATLAAWARSNNVTVHAIWTIGPFQEAYREVAFESLVRDMARYTQRIGIIIHGDPIGLLRPADSGRFRVSSEERSLRSGFFVSALAEVLAADQFLPNAAESTGEDSQPAASGPTTSGLATSGQ